MNDTDVVVDASAVIALLVGEPITRFDPRRIAGASIGTVNLSEVMARLQEIGMREDGALSAIRRLDLRIIAFDEQQAHAAARLRAITRHAGLSLGDRACLALGQVLGHPVATADRAWRNLDVGVVVVLIR